MIRDKSRWPKSLKRGTITNGGSHFPYSKWNHHHRDENRRYKSCEVQQQQQQASIAVVIHNGGNDDESNYPRARAHTHTTHEST